MSLLVLKLILGSGALAILYRFYLKLMSAKETLIETKNTVVINKDEQKDAQDAKAVTDSTDAFNDAVNNFNRDNKS